MSGAESTCCYGSVYIERNSETLPCTQESAMFLIAIVLGNTKRNLLHGLEKRPWPLLTNTSLINE